jgi:hypothetical protein
LDVDNGGEFLNETMIQYCLRNGIELTRSRPYRKNDQAWIEQKNGAVVRKLLGYRRFEGIAAAQALARLYGASRLFVNFFQPSFKLAEKHRQGAQVTKRYHPPETPCERLLQAETVTEPIKRKLREVGSALDPLQLLEEVRAMQSHLVVLSDGRQAGCAQSGGGESARVPGLSLGRLAGGRNPPDALHRVETALSAANPECCPSRRHYFSTSGPATAAESGADTGTATSHGESTHGTSVGSRDRKAVRSPATRICKTTHPAATRVHVDLAVSLPPARRASEYERNRAVR